LKISNKRIGPVTLSSSTLAVVNVADDVAPSVSVKPFIDAMPTRDVRISDVPRGKGRMLTTSRNFDWARCTGRRLARSYFLDGFACRPSRSYSER